MPTPGIVYADDYLTILAMGAGAALAVVAAGAGSVELSKPHNMAGIRNAINGALAQVGLPLI